MFYVAQAGSSLQVISTSGAIQTLSLPTGVTIDATIKGLFAVLAQQLVFVKAGTVNLWIDPATLTVGTMSILPPNSPPTIAAGAGTGLTGAYKVKVQFGTKDASGRVLNLSPASPESLSVTLSNKDLDISNIAVSTNPIVNFRRILRTAAGGVLFFQQQDIDDNSTTEILTTMPDATLSDLPEETSLSIPPGAIPGTSLKLITAWKNRLWAIGSGLGEGDAIRYSDIDTFYAWPALNNYPAYPRGEDSIGVTGFIPRRDELGVCKRGRILKIIGDDFDPDTGDGQVIIVAEGVGCIAPASIVVIRDIGFFLGLDGVYTFGPEGVTPISKSKVDGWFTTDTYFNRSRFPNAFGGFNPLTNSYELHLAALGSSVEDSWVSFQLDTKEWLGPHTTSAFTPSIRATLQDASGVQLAAIGGTDDYLYLMNQTTPSDVSGAGVASAISSQIDTKWHSGKNPDIDHFFGQLSVLNRIETAGTLTITPYIGRLNAAAGTPLTMALSAAQTDGRTRLDRLGTGPLCKLSFTLATAAQRFLIYGYDIAPFFELGRR